MTLEHLHTILKAFSIRTEKDGSFQLPEGSSLTFHLAHDGVSLTVQRVEHVRIEGDLVYARARAAKKETFAIACGDIFAVALDGAPGEPMRRAGFGA